MEKLDVATFAAGCFWGVEEYFRRLKGVTDVISGYTGGHTQNPTYEQVCSDTTGHAEAVQVSFTPSAITYEELVRAFFDLHDPTTKNRQGPDVGSQYRSAIFYHSNDQHETAEKIKDEIDHSGQYDKPVVTEIVEASPFYEAEDYHQQYYRKHGTATCPVKLPPKIEA